MTLIFQLNSFLKRLVLMSSHFAPLNYRQNHQIRWFEKGPVCRQVIRCMYADDCQL